MAIWLWGTFSHVFSSSLQLSVLPALENILTADVCTISERQESDMAVKNYPA